MPILYIHGVAMREAGQEGWTAVKPFVEGVQWGTVEEKLRQYLAPILNPQRPDDVALRQVYWGDLGASPREGQQPPQDLPTASTLLLTELAERLELQALLAMPYPLWPELIEVVWDAAHDAALREQWERLEPAEQWKFLLRHTETQLRLSWRKRSAFEPWPIHQQLGQGLRVWLLEKVAELRGPVVGVLPYFMGDVVGYLATRGTPERPGPIPQRVLEALREMQAIKQQTGEPLVVVTYSMGGQIFFDVINALAPAQGDLQDLQVDFWCAAGSQLGLFASLGLFLRPESAQPDAPAPMARPQQVSYLWNIWTPNDLLSFEADHLITGIRENVVDLTQDAVKAHAAYMTSAFFYEALAQKLKVVMEYKP